MSNLDLSVGSQQNEEEKQKCALLVTWNLILGFTTLNHNNIDTPRISRRGNFPT